MINLFESRKLYFEFFLEFLLSDDRVICFVRKTDDYIDDLNIHEMFYENNKRKIITFVECINFVRKRASVGITNKIAPCILL